MWKKCCAMNSCRVLGELSRARYRSRLSRAMKARMMASSWFIVRECATETTQGSFPDAGPLQRLENSERQICAADRRAKARWARSRASLNGTCVARSTRVEEDGFAGGPFVGCAGGPLP